MKKMNKLEIKLNQIKERGRVGLMTHVIVGYPTIAETIEVVKTMAACGVDIIEMQIPFSDPLADGPTIMKACEMALENGAKVKDAFKVMLALSQEVSIPLLFMAYYNTVFRYGVEQFCRDANKAGASGLIVPDMPIDEEAYEHFYKYCRQYDLHAIHVISPASTERRLRMNSKVAEGFVYCTARQGITGATAKLGPGFATYLERVKHYFTIPLAVGFGISRREHIEALKGYAEIAVVGSAIVKLIGESKKEERVEKVREYIQGLRA